MFKPPRTVAAIANAALMFLLATHAVGAEKANKADFWTFKPSSKPIVPALRKATRPRNPIDVFILAELEKKGLQPSPEADRRTLLRRITFDLTGLPPTPEEAETFFSDRSGDAHERLVDRLLASPAYGERWARHWLDVVHFGETHGYDKDKLRPHAWPYRDYVIRAFNRDTPWSRFVEEQLAGDILAPDSPEGIVATGFLAAGPWDFVGHVELPESKTDGLIARYNDRDDMVMTTMSSFQSLTVHCARCHDHKFDPLTQRDYYNLQAVFGGVDRANRPYDQDPAAYRKRRALLKEKNDLDRMRKNLDAEIAKLNSPELERLNARTTELRAQLATGAKPAVKPKTLGYHSQIASAPEREKWVQVDLGERRRIDEIILIPSYEIFGGHPGPGFGFPERFRIDIGDDPGFKERQIVADETKANYPHPGNAAYSAGAQGRSARYIRVTATRLWLRTGDWIFALGEMAVMSNGTNIASNATVTALDSIEAAPSWGARYLVDGVSVAAPRGDDIDWIASVRQQQKTVVELRKIEAERAQVAQSLIAPETRTRLEQSRGRLSAIEREVAALPASAIVFAAAHDFTPEGSFKPAHPIRAVHLLARGDVKRPKEPSIPAAPAVFTNLVGSFELRDVDDEGSRRAALARWLTDRRNLLTRRSIVNRIWQYHFGRGLIDTPNDFGHMGSLPTHPELLDWLAGWFMEHGESLKALHRLILTSATYRQSSAGDSDYARTDSDNRLLWRMNRARLEAEGIRDSMLAVAGQLDRKMGGPSVQQFFFKDDHSPVYDYGRYDMNDPGSRRRAVYRHIVRSVPDPFMDCLDAADPSLLTPRRNTTLTALQALATLNNPFVLHQAEQFARRLSGSEKHLGAQLALAYRLALGRAPSVTELKEMTSYAGEHGLTNACRVIFNLNEFIFID